MNKKQFEIIEDELKTISRRAVDIDDSIVGTNIILGIGLITLIVASGFCFYYLKQLTQLDQETEKETLISGCVERVAKSYCSILINDEIYSLSCYDMNFIKEGDYVILEEAESSFKSYDYKLKSIKLKENLCKKEVT